ncbi:hypothetical protein GCM10012275_64390 [Longimycelium tulufanense]|uniref:AB hydrolase-1 domain-containing protein n=1 Tax=Longimycelium tulufanense TaxID=907463 RepID=A0A8J3CEW3_9PSEU|nr:alpha/beta fold hydrolase [Longimycelium tulufanense]GGM84791.1 hypothetical protein GCM10012275_64390 [Longimycelium tulufanense]
MSDRTASPRLYRDQQSWRDLQEFLPPELRLGADDVPAEEFWSWSGNDVHLDRYVKPDSPVKVVLHHGVGTNGRQMSLVLGAPLAKRGIETVALDNLGYGLTVVGAGQTPTYADWVDLVVDYVAYERTRDPRPIVLYGLSAGGMLTYHVAARDRDIAGIVGMTFLDQNVQQVRDETASNKVAARGAFLVSAAARTPLFRLRTPMRLVSKMSALANHPGAMKVFLADRTSAGNSVSLRFLDSYLNYTPAVEPEDFDHCPILLTQPAEDRWSPLHLSEPFLNRITKVDKTVVMLDRAGHYPLEQPGLQQMQDAVIEFATRVASR